MVTQLSQKTRDRIIAATISDERITSVKRGCFTEDLELNGLHINAMQEVFFVPSSRMPDRCYIVAWSDEHAAYRCSCGSRSRKHRHITEVVDYIAARKTKLDAKAKRAAEKAAKAKELAEMQQAHEAWRAQWSTALGIEDIVDTMSNDAVRKVAEASTIGASNLRQLAQHLAVAAALNADIEHAMESANQEMTAFIDAVAAKGDRSYVSATYGDYEICECCCKAFKAKYEGQTKCGRC